MSSPPSGHGLTLPVPIKRGAPPPDWKGSSTQEPQQDPYAHQYQEEEPEDDIRWFQEPPYGPGAEVPAGYEPGILYTARCFCRRVEFHVSEAPTAAKICDCTACQQLHGAPLQWAALFPKTSVHFSERSREFLHFYNIGLDRVYTDGAVRDLPCKVRCSHCGTWVADEGRNMFMAFPTLFDFPDGECPDVFKPQCRIFCTAKQTLEDVNSKYGLPCFIDDRRTPATPGDLLRYIVPSLDGSRYKGQCGRVGIIGGSQDFTGAPYFAGMAALRTGADLVYVFTSKEAAIPIKAHSPELMVLPVYERRRILTPEITEDEIEHFVNSVRSHFLRLNALCIGPGLGREPRVLDAVAEIITAACDHGLAVVIDADALALVLQRPDIVKGFDRAVLTPNIAEYRRLEDALGMDQSSAHVAGILGGPLVLRKGRIESVEMPNLMDPITYPPLNHGAPRRPGGLGDLLAGCLSTILAWCTLAQEVQAIPKEARPWACFAASEIIRISTARAYKRLKRGMLASDVLEEIHDVFEEMCPSSDTKGTDAR